MKELTGLKVKAIAVEVPENCNQYEISEGFEVYHNNGDKKTITPTILFGNEVHQDPIYSFDLPMCNWQILGRADEIANDMDLLEIIFGKEKVAGFHANFYEWLLIRDENNLTNELILIEQ